MSPSLRVYYAPIWIIYVNTYFSYLCIEYVSISGTGICSPANIKRNQYPKGKQGHSALFKQIIDKDFQEKLYNTEKGLGVFNVG